MSWRAHRRVRESPAAIDHEAIWAPTTTEKRRVSIFVASEWARATTRRVHDQELSEGLGRRPKRSRIHKIT